MGYNTFSPIVTNGLILYLDVSNYKSFFFSETLVDISGNLNNGIISNGATFSFDGVESILFDGVNDYVSVSSSDSFAYGTGDFTWDFWLNPTTLSGNDYFFDHNVNGGTIAFQDGSVGTGPTGIRYYNTTTGLGSDLFIPGFGGIDSYLTGVWMNLVASRISGITYLYRNGYLVSSGVDTHNYGTQPLNIGQAGNNTLNWNGRISNVKIYKGLGLTSDQVLKNYNALKNRFV